MDEEVLDFFPSSLSRRAVSHMRNAIRTVPYVAASDLHHELRDCNKPGLLLGIIDYLSAFDKEPEATNSQILLRRSRISICQWMTMI